MLFDVFRCVATALTAKPALIQPIRRLHVVDGRPQGSRLAYLHLETVNQTYGKSLMHIRRQDTVNETIPAIRGT